jgi:Sigma-70, region 4
MTATTAAASRHAAAAPTARWYRWTFVLHDMFDLPFDDIASMMGRPPAAARQLASRARRRVRGADVPAPDADLAAQRKWSMPSSPSTPWSTPTASSNST